LVDSAALIRRDRSGARPTGVPGSNEVLVRADKMHLIMRQRHTCDLTGAAVDN